MKRLPNYATVLVLLAGFTGMAGVVAVETMAGTSTLDASIIISRPVSEVFKALVDPANIDQLSQNIGQVKLETSRPFVQGSTYTRILYSHGLPNFQTVTVAELEPDKLLVTKTMLVGFEVTYRYGLTLNHHDIVCDFSVIPNRASNHDIVSDFDEIRATAYALVLPNESTAF